MFKLVVATLCAVVFFITGTPFVDQLIKLINTRRKR